MLHRDVTPHNVLLSRSGGSGRSVKLIDFGLAGRVDDDDARVGTLSYMAPEQLQGAEPTVRSDLYSVGATLYHALTGRPPYALQEYEDKRAFFAAVAKGPLPSLGDLPAPLVPVLRKALAKDPAARFGSCAEMRADQLEDVLPPVQNERHREQLRRAKAMLQWQRLGQPRARQ